MVASVRPESGLPWTPTLELGGSRLGPHTTEKWLMLGRRAEGDSGEPAGGDRGGNFQLSTAWHVSQLDLNHTDRPPGVGGGAARRMRITTDDLI